MSNELSIELRDYLKRCGLSRRVTATCSNVTRLYHDLGIYGDIAENCMEVLADEYGVDLSEFEFSRYFPSEFVGKNALTRALLWIVPFAGHAARARGKYLPLTLEMLDEALQKKSWKDVVRSSVR